MLNQTALYEYVRTRLSLPRFLHSIRTAETAVELCRRYGLSLEEAYVSGIAHDMAREIAVAQVMQLANADSLPLLEEELQRPVLLHGRAAAVLLQTSWGEKRHTVLNAVRWHTQGHSDMGDLGKVLYIADFIEPGRSHITEDFRASILHLESIDWMLKKILEAQFSHLREKQVEISTYALELYNTLEENTLEERLYAKI
ncbi:MAG: bis(5'-nucleosyl)-tetraphosphatase (symmetrical) YqeK [Spirochaetia bacterium]|nr:bis(5'-nucleosyl)-tetraphosphatase (symmetrical) YqeK [Spirochaetia bacterium]